MFPAHRPRRLRTTPAMRRLVSETTVRPRQLVLPMFVKEGAEAPVEIASMPGVLQHTRESLRKAAVEAVQAGVGGIMLFGVPTTRDAV
ncbi:MAG: porphobilinogen synthase, partial [Saccharothrix sp.]|nr:porphobilinogen synthase [Saccharothrix sp.]